MSKLTPEQLLQIAEDHVSRVINSWDEQTLRDYAYSAYLDSLGKTPGQGDIAQDALLRDILMTEGDDEDSVYEFLVGAGVDEDLAQELVSNGGY